MTDKVLRVGQEIDTETGDLNYFGRDFYGKARVEGIGVDWVVVRDEYGVVWMASGRDFTPEDILND